MWFVLRESTGRVSGEVAASDRGQNRETGKEVSIVAIHFAFAFDLRLVSIGPLVPF